jgi:hypothetical protein
VVTVREIGHESAADGQIRHAQTCRPAFHWHRRRCDPRSTARLRRTGASAAATRRAWPAARGQFVENPAGFWRSPSDW